VRRLAELRVSVLALWVVAALLAAGLAGYWLIPRDEPRDDVAQYIEQANETGTKFAEQYGDVTAAYRGFSTDPAKAGSQARRLSLAARRLTALRQELQALEAPPEARRLRLRLLAFYRQQEAVALELAQITAFFNRLAAAERPLARASNSMRDAMTEATTPQEQAAALARYGDALTSVRKQVAAVPAPGILAPTKRAETSRLQRTVASVRDVEASLRANDRVGLQQAVQRLGQVGGGGAAAVRAAILAYNRHVADIKRLGAAVEKERLRLDRELG
jgi:hypothetical protein